MSPRLSIPIIEGRLVKVLKYCLRLPRITITIHPYSEHANNTSDKLDHILS